MGVDEGANFKCIEIDNTMEEHQVVEHAWEDTVNLLELWMRPDVQAKLKAWFKTADNYSSKHLFEHMP